MRLLLLSVFLVAGGAEAATFTLDGLCSGYRLCTGNGCVPPTPDLIVQNGQRGRCQQNVEKRWKSLTVVGMCKGQNFAAKTGSLGNLYVVCVPATQKIVK
jgi:hypothetical protein